MVGHDCREKDTTGIVNITDKVVNITDLVKITTDVVNIAIQPNDRDLKNETRLNQAGIHKAQHASKCFTIF